MAVSDPTRGAHKAAKLYVGNGKLSHEILSFRCPKTNGLRQIRIAAGRQEVITGYTLHEVNQITHQWEPYQFVEVSDIKDMQHARGLVFAVNQEIESDNLQESIEKQKNIAQSVAETEAENAGLATFAAANKTGDVQESELEVVQLEDGKDTEKKGGTGFEYGVSKRASGRTSKARRSA